MMQPQLIYLHLANTKIRRAVGDIAVQSLAKYIDDRFNNLAKLQKQVQQAGRQAGRQQSKCCNIWLDSLKEQLPLTGGPGDIIVLLHCRPVIG